MNFAVINNPRLFYAGNQSHHCGTKSVEYLADLFFFLLLVALNTVLVSLPTAPHGPVTDHHQCRYSFLHLAQKCLAAYVIASASQSRFYVYRYPRMAGPHTYSILISGAIDEFGSDVGITVLTRRWVTSECDPSTAFLDGDIKIS